MQTEELLIDDPYIVRDEDDTIATPATILSLPPRAYAVEEARPSHAWLWVVVILLGAVVGVLCAYTANFRTENEQASRIQDRLTEQTAALQIGIKSVSNTAESALIDSSLALEKATNAQAGNAQTEQALRAIRQSQTLILGKLNELSRKQGDLEKRLPAAVTAGTTNTQMQSKPATGADQQMRDTLSAMFRGAHAFNAKANAETWKVPTANGETIECELTGASNQGIYVRSIDTGVSYFIDYTKKIAMPFGK